MKIIILLITFFFATVNLFSQSLSSKKTFIGGSLNFTKPESYHDFTSDYSDTITVSPNFYHKFNSVFGFSASVIYGSLPLNEERIIDVYYDYNNKVDNWSFNMSGFYVAATPGLLFTLPLGAVDFDIRALLGCL